jgi:tRNA threonylcarbamoyladenosine biosynthesis protein TsaB
VWVLGIDSAGAGASAAVLRDGAIASRRTALRAHGQAEILMPMIAEVLGEAGIAATGLDLIGVAIGPGSFTGLRVGIAAGRGLALAAGVPARGVSSFRALAAQVSTSAREGRPLIVALDTRRQDFYLQRFAPNGEPEGDPMLLGAAAADEWLPSGPLLLAGDAAPRLASALPARDFEVMEHVTQIDPADIARIAAADVAAGLPPAPPRPAYLRAPDVTRPRRMAAR